MGRAGGEAVELRRDDAKTGPTEEGADEQWFLTPFFTRVHRIQHTHGNRQDRKEWPAGPERLGRAPRHPCGYARGSAGAIAPADSAGLGRNTVCATAEAVSVATRGGKDENMYDCKTLAATDCCKYGLRNISFRG